MLTASVHKLSSSEVFCEVCGGVGMLCDTAHVNVPFSVGRL